MENDKTLRVYSNRYEPLPFWIKLSMILGATYATYLVYSPAHINFYKVKDIIKLSVNI